MNSRHELFQLEYNDNKLREKLRNWVCLQPDVPRDKVHDCVISSFHFIDIIKDRTLAEEYATYLNKHKLTGVTGNAILNELYKYIKKTATFSEYDFDKSKQNPYQKWLNIINKELKPTHITILFLKDAKTGHAINAYKDENNELYLIDSQQHDIIPSHDSIDKQQALFDFFTSNNYVNMTLIRIPTSDNSLKRKRGDTLKIRKMTPEKTTSKRTTLRSPTIQNMDISPEISTYRNPLKRKRDDTLKIRKQKSYDKSSPKRTKRRSPTPTTSKMDII